MADVNGTPTPPQVSPFLQITITDTGPVMRSEGIDLPMQIALLEQTKLFLLNQMFHPTPKPSLIQSARGVVNRMVKG